MSSLSGHPIIDSQISAKITLKVWAEVTHGQITDLYTTKPKLKRGCLIVELTAQIEGPT